VNEGLRGSGRIGNKKEGTVSGSETKIQLPRGRYRIQIFFLLKIFIFKNMTKRTFLLNKICPFFVFFWD